MSADVVAESDLRLPDDDEPDPELSIVVPALNEKITIEQFVGWCKEGLKRAGARGEILIVDSSSDGTGDLALRAGARVLRVPKRGLGRAYIDSLAFIRGPYVLMGDCDCTYDFRDIAPFLARLREGAEFVMGSRFRGSIEPGAMPWLHRYVGTPATTWILNVMYGSHFTDIHCGMRAITKAALIRMDLRSQSWEYASEMVLKSVHMGLKTSEVPVRFLKDVAGRQSHHKRSGWFSPWAAAWINLRAMFIYGANFFTFRPGILLVAVGSALTLPMAAGPIAIGPIGLSLHFMLLGLTLVTLGLQCIGLGILTQVFFDYRNRVTRMWLSRFSYTRTTAISAALFAVGMFACVELLVKYVRDGYVLDPNDPVAHLGVAGLLLMIVGFTTFTFTLLLHAATQRRATPRDDE